jgi:hypothetical protein
VSAYTDPAQAVKYLTQDAGDDDVDHFSSLPIEVKERIYEYALRNGGFFNIPLRVANMVEIPKLPRLCIINKLERSISTRVLARNTVLRLFRHSDYTVFLQWLKAIQIPKEKFMLAVKKIQIVYEDRDSFVQNLSFLTKFPVLAELTITIEASSMLDISQERDDDNNDEDDEDVEDDDWDLDENPADEYHILERFDLKQVAGCKALTSLTFHILGHIFVSEIGKLSLSDVDHVAAVCQVSFMEANGRELTVDMASSNIQKKPRRFKVGKEMENYSYWTRMNAGLKREGDEVLTY